MNICIAKTMFEPSSLLKTFSRTYLNISGSADIKSAIVIKTSGFQSSNLATEMKFQDNRTSTYMEKKSFTGTMRNSNKLKVS